MANFQTPTFVLPTTTSTSLSQWRQSTSLTPLSSSKFHQSATQFRPRSTRHVLLTTVTSTIATTPSSSTSSSPHNLNDDSSNSNTDSQHSKSTLQEPVTEIDGAEAYLQTLSSNRDKLTVLKIFAPWCRSCRALVPKVNRLAREHSDIVFVKMNYEANKQLCKRLGIYSMPTFIMYYGSHGEIDKFTCGPTRANVLTRKIIEFKRGYCILDENKDKQVKQPAYQLNKN